MLLKVIVKVFIFTLLIFFSGCEESSSSNNKDTATTNTTSSDSSPIKPIIECLNDIRSSLGMITLRENKFLDSSALNHSKYIQETSLIGHYELNSSAVNFTGVEPSNRALYAGYNNRDVSENLSVGQMTEILSLDGLMSAIYHRFGFLSFSINEIGYGSEDYIYVYEMGNSNISDLCNGSSFTGNGTYYTYICKDEDFKIEENEYLNALNNIITTNPPYAIYPYPSQTEVTPVFFEESPDPLPDYSVSGFPISIEFNSNDFEINNLTLSNFELRDNDDNIIELIEFSDSTSIMKQSNDIQEHFTAYQFSIFPNYRLDFNSTYNVFVSYNYDGDNYELEWSFTTKELKNLIVYNNEDLTLSLDTEYYLYFPPTDTKDTIFRYSIEYTYSGEDNSNIDIEFYDQNTLKVKFSGSSLETVKLILNGESKTNEEIPIDIVK